MRRAAFTLALLVALASAPAAAEPLAVVASFSILADFAREVGGDRATVTVLVGPGGDAHVYEPKPVDAAAVTRADVILVNGLRLEGFLPRLLAASGTKAPVVEVTKGVRLQEVAAGHDHEAHEGEAGHEHGAVDPHAWQSVPNARVYVANIADAFCAADAAGCDTYRANAAAYSARLDALDAEIRAAVAAIPEERRVIITSHDAFGYFAREYGLAFLAPEGVSTDSEASAADVAALIRQARDEKAAAIFVEAAADPRLVKRIAAETGLRLGGALYPDALSGNDGPAPTYLDMMRHNTRTIADAVMAR